MSDEIGIGIDAKGADGVNRLITSIDKLDLSIEKLASHSGGNLSSLAQSMESMQRTMITGFAEMSALAAKSDQKIEHQAAESKNRLLRQQVEFEAKQHASANKFHDRQVEIDVAGENRRATRLQGLIEKRQLQLAEAQTRELRNAETLAAKIQAQDEASANRRRAQEQKQQVDLAAIRAKEAVDAQKIADKIAAQDQANFDRRRAMEQKQQIDLASIRAAAREKERTLEAAFQASSLTSKIRTAEQAQAYGALGGSATTKFGASAATADIASLKAQHDALKNSVSHSAEAMRGHNAVMHDAHGLARGLSGALGGLWLTYGSVIPLLAGAAIAASLKNIVEVGKDVEYQLQFVAALSKTPVDLNKFLSVTDATVVSVHEAAEGMRALAQNGLNATESLRALPDVLNLAVIGEMGVAQAALSATGAVSAFGLQIQDIARVGDIFAQTAASSNTSVLAMTESMRQASTVASIYQVSIEETAAALGTLAKVNIIGSAAGTAYTNMLTNLYSPTKQAERALKELKITTDDGNGGLKNSTQLLSEMQLALSKVNETARASYLGDIFTVRGQKAASTILENLDSYKTKIEDARNSSGFMSEAVAKLEDTVEGASRHLKNAFGASLTQAFASSSGALQEILIQMAHLARSEGTVKLLTALADAALRVTKLLVDHGEAVLMVVAAYAGLRILAAVPAMIVSVGTAIGGLTLSLRTLASLTGTVGLAITALTVAYELFIARTTDVEKADTRMRNSIQTNIDFLERETKALEERNKAREPAKTADKLPVAQQAVESLEKQIKEVPSFGEMVFQEGIVAAFNGMGTLKTKQKELADARRQQWKETALAEDLAIGLSIERTEKERTGTLEAIARLVKKGEVQKTINGELVKMEAQGTEASRAIALSAKKISDDLLANKISQQEATLQLTLAEQKYNAALSGRAPQFDSDAYRAAQEKLRGEIEANRDAVKSTQADIEQAYKDGEISSLSRYARLRDLKVAGAEVDQSLFKRGEALAAAQEKRKIDAEKLENKAADAKRSIAEAEVTYERQVSEEINKAVAATTAFKVTELRKQGQETAAYQLANADLTKRLDQQIATSSDDLLNALAENDGKKIAMALEVLEAFRLQREQIKLTVAEIGKVEAIKKAEKEFDALFTTMRAGIDTVLSKSDSSSGLGAIFRNAVDAQKIYAEGLPGLIAKQKQLQDLVAQSTDPAAKAGAIADLKKLNDEAQNMANVFVDVGQAIEKSLVGAFGKGGQALGNLINVSIAYANKQKQIDEDLAASIKADPAQREEATIRAIKDTESAQIDAFGNMAASAAGFFDSQSQGYKALMVVSQVMHAAQLAMNLASIGPALAAGAAQMFGQSGWGGFAGVAAMTAVVAGFGVAISGGGSSGPTPEDKQASTGTGSVLGDSKAKSESISRALEMLAKNSERGLHINNSMLTALQGIQSGIAGLGGLIARQMGVSNPFAGVKTGANGPSALGTAGLMGAGAGIGLAVGASSISSALFGELGMSFAGPVGAVIGVVVGALVSKLLSSKTSIADQGFSLAKQTVGSAAQGVSGSQYADVRTESLFNNYVNRQTVGLDAAMSTQFGKIVAGLRDGVLGAVDALKLGSQDITDALNNFVIDIPEFSTKGLTGTEIQKQLEAAFSKLGDDMASSVDLGFGAPMASLQSVLQMFQQVGEGTFETLTRLAGNYQVVDAVLKASGQAINQVGLVSVVTHQRLVDMAGGLDKFAERGQYFAQNFLPAGEQLDLLRDAVGKELPLATITSIEQFKNLVQGLNLADEAQMATYTNLMKLAPAYKELADAQETALKARRSLEIEILETQGNAVEVLAARRADEIAELKKTHPELVSLKESLFALQDAAAAATAKQNMELAYLDASGQVAKATSIRRLEELEALKKTNPELLHLKNLLYAMQDTLAENSAKRQMEIAILEAQGKSQQVLVLNRAAEVEALRKTNPELIALKLTMYAVQDAAKKASTQHALDLQLMEALGLSSQALAVKRYDELAAMDASHRATQQSIYDAQDRTKAVTDTFNVLKKAVDAGKESAKAAYDQQVKQIDKEKDIAKAAYEAQTALFKAQKSSAETVYNQIKDATTATLQTAKEANSKIAALASALSSTLSTLRGSIDPRTSRADAQQQIAQALATARATGVLPTADSLKDSLSVITQPSEDLYTTFAEYKRDQLIAARDISDLNTLAGGQQSVSDKQLETLQNQLDVAKAAYDLQVDSLEKAATAAQEAYDAQNLKFEEAKTAAQEALEAETSRLDALLTNAQAQLDVANGTFLATMSVASALTAFTASLSSVMNAQAAAAWRPPMIPLGSTAAPYTPPANTVLDMLEQINTPGGSAPTAEIAATLADLLAKEMANISAPGGPTFSSGAPGLQVLSIGAHANGGIGSGWSLVGETGPEVVNFSNPGRVYTAEQTQSMFGGGNSAGAEEQMRKLNARMEIMQERLEAALLSIAKSSRETADIQDSWDKVGTPDVREEE